MTQSRRTWLFALVAAFVAAPVRASVSSAPSFEVWAELIERRADVPKRVMDARDVPVGTRVYPRGSAGQVLLVEPGDRRIRPGDACRGGDFDYIPTGRLWLTLNARVVSRAEYVRALEAHRATHTWITDDHIADMRAIARTRLVAG